jgi:translocation and assembly module TamB
MRALRILGWTAAAIVALVALTVAGLQTDAGKRALAGAISSPSLEVAGISGFVPTDLAVAKVEMRDAQGAWLRVEDARARWSFTSLFTGRLRIDVVSAQKIEVLRPPVPKQSETASSGGSFSLPVGIDLGRLAVDDLHLGAPLGGGVDSHWKLAGSGLMPAHGPGRVKLDMARTDGPTATLTADVGFDLDHFTVDGTIDAEESSQGGVAAALIGRPDLKSVSFKLAAKGGRDDGTASLTAAAGDAMSSSGGARWHRAQGATAVSLDVSAVAPGLPDSPIARLLRKPATLKGEATLDDAGVLVVKSLTLAVGPATLEASGRYDSTHDTLDATTALTTLEAGPLADLAGGATWSALHVEAKTALSGVSHKPQGTVSIKGGADGLSAAALDPRAPPPGHVDLAAEIGLDANGRIVVKSFQTTSPLAGLKGSADYLPSSKAVNAKLAIDLADLKPLSSFAGMSFGGRGHLDLTLAGKQGAASVDWQGSLDDLTVPDLPPDLQSPTVKLSGKASLQEDHSWRLDDVKIASDPGNLTLSGRGRGTATSFTIGLDMPKLGKLSADLALDSANGGLKGTVKADGTLAHQALALAGNFAQQADGGVRVPALQGSWASASVDAKDLAVTSKGATGSGHLKMDHLEDLKSILGVDLGGSVALDITTSDDPAGKVTVAVRGDKLRSGATAVGSLRVDGTVTDPMGKAVTDVTLKADRLSGVPEISQVSATVKGDKTALDVGLKVAGASTASLQARIEPTADDIRIVLQRLDARYRDIPIALNAPARLRVMGSRVAIEAASLRVGGGRLDLRGTVDPAASDLTADLSGLPLALVDSFAPGTDLQGTLQAKAHVVGALANPRVDASYAASGLRIKRPETALLPALELKGTLAMANHQATFDSGLSAGSGTQLSLKGKASIPQGNAPLVASVAITGSASLAPFSPALGTSVRNVAGTLQPNLSVTVQGDKITGSGTITLSGAAVYLPASGMRLTGGQATLALQGDTLQLEKLAFQTGRNGEISATGSVHLDPAQGFPVDLSVVTRQALLANRPDILATVSSNIKVTGTTTGGFDVSGPVTVDRAEIAIGVSQAANYPTIAVREINGGNTPTPEAPKPPPPAAGAKQPPKAPDGVRLDLTINAPQAVFVRGRGLDAEVGGQFTVKGNPEAPQVIGNLALRRGKFDLLGHQLDFTRGNVALANVNEIDPDLDFAATTTVESTTIEIDITGSSRAPKISLTSSPELPQDEAMAMLLFGKTSANLSPVELLSAAQSLAELTGGTPPSGGFLGRLRSSVGLDRLSVNSSSTTNADGTTSSTTALQGGRYVAPGVYVGAEQGASGDSSRGVVEIEVFKHTKIEGAVGTNSDDKIGAKMEWDY